MAENQRPQVTIEPNTADSIHITINTKKGEVVMHVSHETLWVQSSDLKVQVQA